MSQEATIGPSPLAARVELPRTTTFEIVGDAEVPWNVVSFEDDYHRIRNDAAILDLTGAGLVGIEGPGAEAVLDGSLSRDACYMTPERTIMALVLHEDGHPLDVVTVFRTAAGFLLLTSVGRGDEVRRTFENRAGERAKVRDATSDYAVLAVEGPRSVELLGSLLPEPIEGLPFQSARSFVWEGTEVVLSRTGSTGEFGFTLLVPWSGIEPVWAALESVIGLAGGQALETAMVEIRQPLLLREVLDDDTVTTAGLNWLIDLDKPEFIGREGVLADFEAGTVRRPVSVVSSERLSPGDDIHLDDELVGRVVHAVESPGLDGWCAVARLDAEVAVCGLDLRVGADGHAAQSAPSPMRVPTSWLLLGS